MNHPKHKLCIILDELNTHQETEQDEASGVDNTEEEHEVWQFDPGICG